MEEWQGDEPVTKGELLTGYLVAIAACGAGRQAELRTMSQKTPEAQWARFKRKLGLLRKGTSVAQLTLAAEYHYRRGQESR